MKWNPRNQFFSLLPRIKQLIENKTVQHCLTLNSVLERDILRRCTEQAFGETERGSVEEWKSVIFSKHIMRGLEWRDNLPHFAHGDCLVSNFLYDNVLLMSVFSGKNWRNYFFFNFFTFFVIFYWIWILFWFNGRYSDTWQFKMFRDFLIRQN